jgi:hypothetical protein
MPVYQSQQNAYMAFKVQSALGTQASGASGTIFRQVGGAGGQFSRAATQSQEVRRDAMSIKGRLGTGKTVGAWQGEMSLASFEEIFQAVMRDTWDASVLTVTQAGFTSLTTGANTIVGASGDMRTLGFRVGDIIYCTGLADAANNSKNLRITGLTASTITVAETLVVNAVADTTCSILRPKKLIMGGTPIKRYYTIDEYDADIDQSEVMTDFMWGMLKLSMAPNGIITLDASGAGTGQQSALLAAASPLLTAPTLGSTSPLSVVDATIRIAGSDVIDLTAFDLTLDIKPTAPDVFGSGAIKYSPDVFPGSMEVSLNITSLRKDLQRLLDFIGETSYSLQIKMVDQSVEPQNFFNVYVGNFTLGQAQKAALSKAGGPRTQTLNVPAALVGIDNTGTGYDASMVKFQSTSA